MVGCFSDMWDKIPTNKKAGLLYSNGTDGQAWSDAKTGGPFYFEQAGYAFTMPGQYQPGAEDYTQQISEFKKFGAEICSGAAAPGDFTNFWSQAIQQGYNPKICTMGQALNFAETANAIGESVIGLTTEISWHPDYPYKSSLTGQTCTQLADAYETPSLAFGTPRWRVDAKCIYIASATADEAVRQQAPDVYAGSGHSNNRRDSWKRQATSSTHQCHGSATRLRLSKR